MKAKLVLCLTTTSLLSLASNPVQQKPHESWWEKNLNFKMHDFEIWLGNDQSLSRKVARDYVLKSGYQSILDIPCGLGTDYIGYQKAGASLNYLGIDITKKLVDRAQSLGIPVLQGSIEAIPLSDNSVDVCYARHILEHLDYYEKAIDELIRVAKKEALIIFFMKPINEPDKLDLALVDGQPLYHNYYNRQKIENHINKNTKVDHFLWEAISEDEEILHILLR